MSIQKTTSLSRNAIWQFHHSWIFRVRISKKKQPKRVSKSENENENENERQKKKLHKNLEIGNEMRRQNEMWKMQKIQRMILKCQLTWCINFNWIELMRLSDSSTLCKFVSDFIEPSLIRSLFQSSLKMPGQNSEFDLRILFFRGGRGGVRVAKRGVRACSRGRWYGDPDPSYIKPKRKTKKKKILVFQLVRFEYRQTDYSSQMRKRESRRAGGLGGGFSILEIGRINQIKSNQSNQSGFFVPYRTLPTYRTYRAR